MTLPDFDQKLENYADIIVRVGLNIQPGQRLLIGATSWSGSGTPLEAAPLVRWIATKAYQAGARFVDVIWSDDQLKLIRLQHAPRDSFEEFPAWCTETTFAYGARGDALLILYGEDPDLFKGQDPDLMAAMQQATSKHRQPILGLIGQRATNFSVASVPVPGWSAKVFPDAPPEEREAKMWATIFKMCRVDQDDPVAGWEKHVDQLGARSDYLTGKGYQSLKLTAPGTDLTVELPDGHIWRSGCLTSPNDIHFVANVPTEELFTIPHRDKVEGVVTATRPLSYGGALIEDFSLTFEGGRVVKAIARQGEANLWNLLGSDEGARRVGEVALVPHSSPISQSGLMFYNTLFDENASCHFALGNAYKFCVEGGETMSNERFAAIGGNQSMIHVDFMVGSNQMNVDGLTAAGDAEPLLRDGEWAFAV